MEGEGKKKFLKKCVEKSVIYSTFGPFLAN